MESPAPITEVVGLKKATGTSGTSLPISAACSA